MPVNTSNSIGAKARFVLYPTENVLTELLTSTANGGATGTTASTGAGVAYIPSTSSTTWTVDIPDIDPYVVGDFSIFWYGYMRDNAVELLINAIGSGFGWQFLTDANSSGNVVFALYTKWGGQSRYSNVIPITDGTLHTIGMRYTASSTLVEYFFDGVAAGSGTITIDPGAMGTGQVQALFGASGKPTSLILLSIFKGALSNTEFSTLASSPLTFMSAGAITMVGAASTQGNTSPGGVIGVGGVFLGAASNQANTSPSGAITKTQDLSAAICTQANTSPSTSLDPYRYLKGLLSGRPKYSWTKVNINSFDDLVIPTIDNGPSPGSKRAVIYAWSSFAWDETRVRLMLWGGGHANYSGNEMYLWDGTTGYWSFGSMPGKLDMADPQLVVINKDSPESSHTYQNNVYLKNQDMFVTFGGANTPSGGAFEELYTASPRVIRHVGPWAFDMKLTDPNKVAGATGSGWDPTMAGTSAWHNRRDMVDGYPIDTLNHVNQAACYVDESGTDVVYLTMDSSSGFPNHYKYTFGDIRGGGRDTCTKIAETWNSVVFLGFGVFDTTRGWFYRNAVNLSGKTSEISAINPSTATGATHDTPIDVQDEAGTPFDFTAFGGIYDPDSDTIWLWNSASASPGRIYYIKPPAYDPVTGWASTVWTAVKIDPVDVTPHGNHLAGVLGKIKYISALNALIVLDSAQDTWDPGVWLFKLNDPTYELVGASSSQANSCSVGSIASFAGAVCTQPNTCSNANISGLINLAGDSSIQPNSCGNAGITQHFRTTWQVQLAVTADWTIAPPIIPDESL